MNMFELTHALVSDLFIRHLKVNYYFLSINAKKAKSVSNIGNILFQSDFIACDDNTL